MSIMLRISLLLGALFALGIVIHSVRKSRIRISDSVFWVTSATLLLLFALIPQIPFFFSQLFGFVSTSNFVLVVVIALMLIKLFHQSCSISQLTHKVESLSATIALHDKKLRDEKNLDHITDSNHSVRT